jgi:hypothetical protein
VTSALLTTAEAAAVLRLTAKALLRRLSRHARRRGRHVVAELGDGVEAFKFGRTWRFRISPGGATTSGGARVVKEESS